MGLLLHCGASTASEKAVRAVRATAKSLTHEPLDHGEFIDMTRGALSDLGIEAGEGQYGLTPDGEDLFGLIELPKNVELPYMENVRDRLRSPYSPSAGCTQMVHAVRRGVMPVSMMKAVADEYFNSESDAQREAFQDKWDANRLVQAFTHVNQKKMGRAASDFSVLNRIASRSNAFMDMVLRTLPPVSEQQEKLFSEDKDSRYVIGLRNSNRMKFRAGFLLAEAPFVCDNLAFCGEVRVQHKHTLNIHTKLPALIKEKLNSLMTGNLGQN
tara:strand:- start:12140 stop:12949 length:810 start_codon:yes stop_codon:yes gene_type:complete